MKFTEIFQTPDNGSTNSGPAASKVPAEDWNIFSRYYFCGRLLIVHVLKSCLDLSSEESPAAFRRLVRTHQLCAAEKQSLQLMVNHLQLQTSALQSKNRQLASAADQLSVEMAETEERCMLQQVRRDQAWLLCAGRGSLLRPNADQAG